MFPLYLKNQTPLTSEIQQERPTDYTTKRGLLKKKSGMKFTHVSSAAFFFLSPPKDQARASATQVKVRNPVNQRGAVSFFFSSTRKGMGKRRPCALEAEVLSAAA
jgi:hypothetical protein